VGFDDCSQQEDSRRSGFAADALGFFGDKNLQVHTLDNWLRLSSKSGYVMVKFPGGHDFGPDDED
jgi:hypothetical protein